jgi:hypothetical protein
LAARRPPGLPVTVICAGCPVTTDAGDTETPVTLVATVMTAAAVSPACGVAGDTLTPTMSWPVATTALEVATAP